MASPHAVFVSLSQADRATLEGWTRRRKTAQALAMRARIVLACAEAGATNGAVAEVLGVSRQTVATWRRRFTERGADGLLDEPRPGALHQITDEQVERAVITTLEDTPPNATQWSTRSLVRIAVAALKAAIRNRQPPKAAFTTPIGVARRIHMIVATLGVEDGCDGGSAAFGSGFAGQAEAAQSASCGVAGAPAAVLGVHCRGFAERGRSDWGWGIAAGRVLLVPGGGRDGAVAPVAVVEAAVRALSLLCGARGDRAVAGAGFGRAGGRAPAGAVGIDGFARAAAQRGDAGRQPGLPGDYCAVAR